jgi:hypothetical protein
MMNVFKKEQNAIQTIKDDILDAIVQNKVDQNDLLTTIDKHEHDTLESLRDDMIDAINKIQVPQQTENGDDTKGVPLIPRSMTRLFAGMARVNRNDFFERFDTGVPQDDTTAGNEQVLLLYSDDKALPEGTTDTKISLLPVEKATA